MLTSGLSRYYIPASVALCAAIFFVWWNSSSARLERKARSLMELCRFQPGRSPAEDLFRVNRMRGQLAKDAFVSVRLTSGEDREVSGRDSIVEAFAMFLRGVSESEFRYELSPAEISGDRGRFGLEISGSRANSPGMPVPVSGSLRGDLVFVKEDGDWLLSEVRLR